MKNLKFPLLFGWENGVKQQWNNGKANALSDVCYGCHGVFVFGLCQNILDFGNLFAKRKTQEKTVVKIGVARGQLRLAFLVICKSRHINTKVIACNGTKKHKENK